MPDICKLILDEHGRFRRAFADLDDLRAAEADATELAAVWDGLAQSLVRHAAVEERVFYPALLRNGDQGEEETEDALGDHEEIRQAVERASGEDVGSAAWWEAVLDARKANGDHMAEEETGALADFRENVPASMRDELGEEWLDLERRQAA